MPCRRSRPATFDAAVLDVLAIRLCIVRSCMRGFISMLHVFAHVLQCIEVHGGSASEMQCPVPRGMNTTCKVPCCC